VANTLRRKMFKLGGEVNTHGVGITSGLEYRRPGYNSGGPVLKPGPDGKLRQHAILGGIMPLVNAVKLAARLKNPLKPLASYVSGGSKLTARPTKKMIAKMKPDEIKRVLGSAGFGPGGRFSQAGRLSNLIGLGSIPFAGASLLAGPRMTPEERETATDFQKGLDTTRGVVEALPAFSGLGFGAEVAGNIGDAIYESRKQDPNYSLQTVPELIRKMAGASTPTEEIKKDTPGPSTVVDTLPMETAATQEEQFAKMKADADARADMYYSMLSEGGPDKVRALADAFTAAGAVFDEDKAAALSAFKGGIDQELDRDEALRDESRRLGLNDILSTEAETREDKRLKAQMLEQAKLSIMSSPDLTAAQRTSAIQGIQAYQEGVVDILPTDAKGEEADTSRMAAGTIYFDPNNLYGGMYVAKPTTEGAEVKAFTTLQEAQAHAAS
tara:strand:+ start:7597 stop:8916 length:1320 start_codon:yes stop_codon:yes gene_type:complete